MSFILSKRIAKSLVWAFKAIAGVTFIFVSVEVAAAPNSGARYVALGSSYAAGPGVGGKDKSSGVCARSMDNYARQVARHYKLDLHDVSCSGATTNNILNSSQGGFAPQIEAVTADTKLVSMTIGGNDVNYIGNLLGKSCRDEALASSNALKKCSFISSEELGKRLASLEEKITNVVNAIKQRAPLATIVIVNYLPVIPDQGVCTGLPLTNEDRNALLNTYHRLVTIEKKTAEKLNVMFIPAAQLGAGHDACSANPYTTLYHPSTAPSWSSPVAYHPTLAGMNAVAKSMIDALVH